MHNLYLAVQPNTIKLFKNLQHNKIRMTFELNSAIVCLRTSVPSVCAVRLDHHALLTGPGFHIGHFKMSILAVGIFSDVCEFVRFALLVHSLSEPLNAHQQAMAQRRKSKQKSLHFRRPPGHLFQPLHIPLFYVFNNPLRPASKLTLPDDSSGFSIDLSKSTIEPQKTPKSGRQGPTAWTSLVSR